MILFIILVEIKKKLCENKFVLYKFAKLIGMDVDKLITDSDWLFPPIQPISGDLRDDVYVCPASYLGILYSKAKQFFTKQSKIKRKNKKIIKYEMNQFPNYYQQLTTFPKIKNINPTSKVMGPYPNKLTIPIQKTKSFLFGIGDREYQPIFYESNVVNEKAALDGRILKQMITPDPVAVKEFTAFFKKNIFKLLPKTYRTKVRTPPFKDYILNSNAQPSVKRTLIKINSELEAEGINNETKLSSKLLQKWTVRKSFVKVEHTNYRSGGIHKVKAPRLIQGAKPQYICLVGPWVMNLQQKVKRDLNKNNFVCFTSGVATGEAAKLLTSLSGLFFENDVAAWDASYSEFLCLLELWMCIKLGAPRAVVDLIRHNIKKRGVTTNGWIYSINGIRASGDPFTSLFNSIMNAMMHLWVFCKHYNFPFHIAVKKLVMLVQGDDNAMNHLHDGTRPDWKSFFIKLGFSSESIYRKVAEDIQFCSMRLYPVVGGYNFGPKIGKVLSKIGYFLDPPKTLSPKVIVKGTALGFINACSFLEPMQIYFSKILDLTQTVHSPKFIDREEWQMRFSVSVANEATLLSLYHKYGWTGTIANYFTREISRCQLGTDTVGPIFRFLCDTDTAAEPMFLH